VVWLCFFFYLFVNITWFYVTFLGSISHPKLCPPHTKRLSVLLVLPLFVLEVGKVHIVHPVEETDGPVTDIAIRKMKVHQEV
jgi:NADH:ubiquinone oxidoreductase subunit 5 (subunit L)/multisubunit Na+/H+ antiporter MnhA subunit